MGSRETAPACVQVRVIVGVRRIQLIEAQHSCGGVGGGTGHYLECVHRWDYPGVVEGIVPRRSVRVNGSVAITESDCLKD